MFTSNSAIYKYFHRTGDAAKCLFCKKVLLCKKSSSKGLWTHLKSMHNEKYVKFKKKLEAKQANAVKAPPKKLAQTVMGRKKVYKYLETVKSWEELDKLRFKNHCSFIGLYKRRKNNFKSIITPCSWRVNGKQCEFVLKALRPDLESGTIHVYSFSKHNHPLESDEKRLLHAQPKELMPDANPPATIRTLDNLEWTFIQTFRNFEKMHQFRHENQCQSLSYDSMWKRVRYSCIRRRSTDLCKFKLMAMKTPKQAYHVYKYGEHNHVASKLKKKDTKGLRPPAAADNEDPPAAIIRTSDKIEWKFLQTFPDYDTMDEFRCENLCSSRPLDTTQTMGNGQIRYSCNRRFSTNRCQFQLLAMETTTNKKGYHVYQHGEHKHPVIKRETEKEHQSGDGQQQNIDKQIQMEEDGEENDDDDEQEDEDEEEDDDDEQEDEDEEEDDDDEQEDEDEEEDEEEDDDDSDDDPDYKLTARQKDIRIGRRGTRRTNGILVNECE